MEALNQYGLPDKVQLLFDHYKDIDIPFGNRRDFKIDYTNEWTLSEFMDLVLTYSPVQNMLDKRGMTTEEGKGYFWKRYLEYGITEREQTEVQQFTRVIGMAADIKN